YLKEDLFKGFASTGPQLPAEGVRRYAQLGLRGATLGFGGTQIPPQGLGESLAEMVGSVPTIAGISAALSPLAAATGRVLGVRALRVPLVQRLATASGTGGVVSGVQAMAQGRHLSPSIPQVA